jgi:hypothetical protein
MPTQLKIDLRPNVSVCVFVPDDLDNVLLPDFSTIDTNMLNVPFDDSVDNTDSVSCNMHKRLPCNSNPFTSMTDSTITCDTTDNDSVGNASIASIEVYEVFDDDIEYCFHGPKIIPKNETPAMICTVNTMGAIHSR